MRIDNYMSRSGVPSCGGSGGAGGRLYDDGKNAAHLLVHRVHVEPLDISRCGKRRVERCDRLLVGARGGDSRVTADGDDGDGQGGRF